MEKVKKCGCSHCGPAKKKNCAQTGSSKPCEKIKICPECKAQYLAEYDECPSCISATEK